MNPTLAAILPWLLPPVCGVLAGYGLGRFVLRRLAFSLIAGKPSSSDAADELAEALDIGRLSSWLLTVPLARVVPESGSASAISLERAITDFLRTLLGSRGTIYAVRDAVSNFVAGLAARHVGDVSRELGLQAILEDKLLPALLQESSRKSISRAAGDFVAGQAGVALDDGLLREVSGIFESYVPEAVETMVRWLRSPETRATLSDRGRELLPRILEKLSEMQKFFISAGQFDRRLDEKMPEIVDETVQAVEKMVRDPLQQKRIVGLFFASACDWRDSLLSAPTASARPWKDVRQKLSESASRLLGGLLARLEDPVAREAVSRLAGARLLEDRRTLGTFFRDVFGVLDSQIVDGISALVLDFLTRPDSAREIARRLCSLLFSYSNEHADTTIASALGINAEQKARLDASLRAGVPRVAVKLMPLVVPAVGKTLASNRRFGLIVGLFGGSIGLVVGLLVMFLRLID